MRPPNMSFHSTLITALYVYITEQEHGYGEDKAGEHPGFVQDSEHAPQDPLHVLQLDRLRPLLLWACTVHGADRRQHLHKRCHFRSVLFLPRRNGVNFNIDASFISNLMLN